VVAVEEQRVLATATDMSEVGIIVGSETDMPVFDFPAKIHHRHISFTTNYNTNFTHISGRSQDPLLLHSHHTYLFRPAL
jgi:hypothetical protein